MQLQSTGNVFRRSTDSATFFREFIPDQFLYILAYLFFLFFLAACLDGNANKVELTGQVLDRTLAAGTKVCFDISENGKCDPDEPFALTNANGIYTLVIPEDSFGKFSVVVESFSKDLSNVSRLSTPEGKEHFNFNTDFQDETRSTKNAQILAGLLDGVLDDSVSVIESFIELPKDTSEM